MILCALSIVHLLFDSLFVDFILFLNVFLFFILLPDYNLCFIGSPCFNGSYYNYNSAWTYYIVIHLLN